MEVINAIKKRYSVREFDERKIEQGKLERILEAGRLAPSAKNRQEWRFIVVKDQTIREELAKAANNQRFVAQAPVVIAACGTDPDYTLPCGHPGFLVDVTIAVDHLTLKAVEEGLGTCWIGAFDEDEVKKILHIPKEVRVVSLLPLGYPATPPSSRHTERKELSEIVMYNQWESS